MNCRRFFARASAAALLAMLQVCVGPVWAKVGLPVKIRMPANSPQAEAGKVYAGVIEIDVGKAGVLDDFDVFGEGWSVTTIDRAAQGKHAQAGPVRVPFRAIPTDPDKPIRLSLRYNGRKVTRTFSIGPKKFAQRGRSYPTTAMNAGTVPAGAAVPVSTNAADEPSGALRKPQKIAAMGQVQYDNGKRPCDVAGQGQAGNVGFLSLHSLVCPVIHS